MTVEKVVLEKLRIGLEQRFTQEFLREGDIQIIEDWAWDSMRVQFKSFVWAEQGKLKSQEVKFPKTWRDAFKKRWFPSWALMLFPVEYRRVELYAKCLYPEFVPSVPDQEYRIAVFKSELGGCQ